MAQQVVLNPYPCTLDKIYFDINNCATNKWLTNRGQKYVNLNEEEIKKIKIYQIKQKFAEKISDDPEIKLIQNTLKK